MPPIYNFSAGPAAPPCPLRPPVPEEMTRPARYYYEAAQAMLRELARPPEGYRFLLLPWGAAAQLKWLFCQLLPREGRAALLPSGHWSRLAAQAAAAGGVPAVPGASRPPGWPFRLPEWEDPLPAQLGYLCLNNTDTGAAFPRVQRPKGLPLAVDASSVWFAAPVPLEKADLWFASAQKNLGSPGFTVMLARQELLRPAPFLPEACQLRRYLRWEDHPFRGEERFRAGLFLLCQGLRHLEQLGGLEAAGRLTGEKSRRLYAFLEQSQRLRPMVEEPFRSLTNVTFTTGSRREDLRLTQAAERAGLLNLGGQLPWGGLRASCYLGAAPQAVEALVAFLTRWEENS